MRRSFVLLTSSFMLVALSVLGAQELPTDDGSNGGDAPCSTGSVACPATCTVDVNSCKPVPGGGGQTCIMICKNRTP